MCGGRETHHHYDSPSIPHLNSDDIELTCEKLGSGANGDVLHGNYMGASVAVKFCGEDEDGETCLMNEARVLCGIRHPCVVECYGVVNVGDGEKLGLVMEEMDGSLFACLSRCKRKGEVLSGEVVMKTARGIAEGVRVLHGNGWIWGDAKSLNCLVRDWGRKDFEVKLADMGLARRVGAGEDERRWDVGNAGMKRATLEDGELKRKKWSHRRKSTWLRTNKGTLAYLAPEAWRGHSDDPCISKASDIFAVGVILYELLTLKRPWKGCNGWDVYRSVVEEGKRPEWPTDHSNWSGWKLKMKHLVESCWSCDWEYRPSVARLAEEIESIKRYLKAKTSVDELAEDLAQIKADLRQVRRVALGDQSDAEMEACNEFEPAFEMRRDSKDTPEHSSCETYRDEKKAERETKTNLLSPQLLAKFDVQLTAFDRQTQGKFDIPLSPVSSAGSETSLSIRLTHAGKEAGKRTTRGLDFSHNIQISGPRRELRLNDVSEDIHLKE